ncbi:MAG: type II toxin-antitoxin system HipA family toxin [Deltaproteobacteria bacterium]|jgi:serine/threonine-protein kinase HipA
MSSRAIEVWADARALSGPRRMGTLGTRSIRQKELFAFEYDDAWLERPPSAPLDPALRLYRGPQYLADGRPNFGVFLDSSPDRWGRVLLQRREALRARREARRTRTLTELDYLLGVHDSHRMGALRFREGGGPFLDDDADLAAPPWTSLRELEAASLHLEREGSENHRDYEKWLRMLVAPGRSLGGARPKASVVDPSGELWIAKFPSAKDEVDVGGWEAVTYALAERAGLTVTAARFQRFGRATHHTFLSKRFDRARTERLHFVSAMTLLERSDGEPGASYLELAALIARVGAQPSADLEQLWRRIVFSMVVSNVDDHLRNHGFLLTPKGWVLSPAYDLNPVPYGDGLSLNVSTADNAQDLALAREVAAFFRVSAARARVVEDEVLTAVRRWPEAARKLGLSRAAQAAMAPAFRVAHG